MTRAMAAGVLVMVVILSVWVTGGPWQCPESNRDGLSSAGGRGLSTAVTGDYARRDAVIAWLARRMVTGLC
jgi:hypothetical protein